MVYLVQIDKAYNKVKQHDNLSVKFGKGENGGLAFELTKTTFDCGKDYRVEY